MTSPFQPVIRPVIRPVFQSVLQRVTLIACLLLALASRGFCAEAAQAPPETKPSPAEIKAVIKTLEDPEKRKELLKTLKVMAEAQQPAASENQLKSVAAKMLSDIAKQVDGVTGALTTVAGTVYEIPAATSWLKKEMMNPNSRRKWTEVTTNLILTLGFGYLAYYLIRLGLRGLRRSACRKTPRNVLFRLLGLLGVLAVDLLPIIAFAVAAYFTLGIIGAREKTRLAALAWVNAFIIAHIIIALFNLLLAPLAPTLRLFRLKDENASYLMIWAKRLTYGSVYGYFALQAALLLGLPMGPYGTLVRLLGLIITVLLIIMILQSRETVAQYISQLTFEKRTEPAAGAEEDVDQLSDIRQRTQGIRNRLAKSWHLLASLYVILLYGVWALHIPGGFYFLFKATALTVVTLLIVRTVLGLLNTLFRRGFKVGDELKLRFPGLEKRANQYISTLHRTLRIGVYFFGALTILQTWGVNTFGWLASEPGRVLGSTVASVVGILLVTFLIWEITNSLIENSLAPSDPRRVTVDISARTRTLLTVARKALAIVLTVVSSLMVLAQLGLNIAPLLAGAGVLGLAIGFGSQKLVQDVITGVFILLEDQMAVGDVVDLGGLGGVVEAVSIRTVRLRDVAGTVHTIPFSAISTVSNKTKDFSFYVMDVGIGYRENVDEVMTVLTEIGAELQNDPLYGPKILEPLEILGVDALAASSVVIRARLKTVPAKQWWVGREYNRRMKNRFDELDIEIPFPHQTIYFGVDKKGNAPPAHLSIGRGAIEQAAGNQGS